ncbi:MAG: beta-N-acetylhexosaminidase [Anaerolineales bacterium]|nr:beta-N-acetylhexosaminidase [Anaerolineales bacterium]
MKQLMLSFHGDYPPPEILASVRRGDTVSFCLFTHSNVVSPAQLYDLTSAIYAAAAEGGHLPPLIGIDQEGGQLMAVQQGATELPGNMALGATRSPELAEKAGAILGRELLAMGVNLNFAPSLDLNTNPANPVIGIRSFGEDPELVAALGVAFIQGMQAEGVLATAKHFPGHGDTQQDSHLSMPVVVHTIQRTTAVELTPFRAAVEAKVGAIMSAHILFTAYDSDNPATLSNAVLDGLLRHDMGYQGLIITDAMDMHAVAQYGHLESVQAALKAGADLVMLGHIPDQFQLGQEVAHLTNTASLQRIEATQRQVRTERPPLSVVGSREHQHIAQAIADRSITLVKDTHHRIPLQLGADELVSVISIAPLNLTPADTSAGVRVALVDAIRRRHSLVQSIEIPYHAPDSHIRAALEASQHSKTVIVGTINADNDPSQAALVRALVERGQQPIVVALRTPYDIRAFPMIDTYLCAYGIRGVTTEAVARVLFGEIEATGVLPCHIPME